MSLDTFPTLPGIDSNKAYTLLQGRLKLFEKIIKKFADNNRQFREQFSDAWQQGDVEKATRLVHTLKGLSGNIGALDLQYQSQMLESACKGNDKEIAPLLDRTQIELTTVIAGIDTYQPTHLSPQRPPMETAVVINQLLELQRQLENYNTRAIDIVSKIHPYFATDNSGQQMFNQINQYIQRLDFEKAAQLLKDLIEAIRHNRRKSAIEDTPEKL